MGWKSRKFFPNFILLLSICDLFSLFLAFKKCWHTQHSTIIMCLKLEPLLREPETAFKTLHHSRLTHLKIAKNYQKMPKLHYSLHVTNLVTLKKSREW